MTDALDDFPDDWERALVIVAHPDDVEWGASAAVAAWTAAGHRVAYLLATRGEAGIEGVPPAEAGPLREAEQRHAGREVGSRTSRSSTTPTDVSRRASPCGATWRPGSVAGGPTWWWSR